MSVLGYQRKSGPCRRYICFALDSRHSNADVRFSANFVCFAPVSGPLGCMVRESESDPKTTSAKTGQPSLRQTRFS